MRIPSRSLSLILLAPFAVACIPSDPPPAPPKQVEYEDANAKLGVDVEARQAERGPRSAEGKVVRAEVAFGQVTLTPEEATVISVLEVEYELKSAGDGYTDIDLAWYVNDVERVGIRSKTLDAERGRFVKGDRVKAAVRALASDGQMIEATSKPLLIRNAPPEIVTDARSKRGLDGLRLKAQDADGDPVRWSIHQGPPGVSIDQRGRIRVEAVNLEKDYDGEVVVFASDPDGGRAEFHVPVKINAAVEEQVAKRTVTEVKTRETMTDEEYEKANLDNLDKIEGMSDEEFSRHTEEQETADEKRRRLRGK